MMYAVEVNQESFWMGFHTALNLLEDSLPDPTEKGAVGAPYLGGEVWRSRVSDAAFSAATQRPVFAERTARDKWTSVYAVLRTPPAPIENEDV